MQRQGAKNSHSNALTPAETKSRQLSGRKSPQKRPYSESYRKRAVCEDWMVVCAVRYEPVSTRISLIRAVLQGIFREIRAFAQKRS
jgi:hypothetical protein